MRHGESEANVLRIFSNVRDKYPLTDRGIEQVTSAAKEMASLSLDGIICSPVLRTRQTAEIAADILRLNLEVDDRIRETDLHSLEGKPLREMAAIDRTTFGIETWISHVERMRDCVSRNEGSYLLVSHALPIRALICSYLGIEDENSCKGVEIGYASLSGVLCGTSKVISIGSRFISENFRKRFSSV